jgi:hypothetical protein
VGVLCGAGNLCLPGLCVTACYLLATAACAPPRNTQPTKLLPNRHSNCCRPMRPMRNTLTETIKTAAHWGTTHLPPDMSCRSRAGEGRQGHRVQPVLLWYLCQQVAQVVVLNNEPAGDRKNQVGKIGGKVQRACDTLGWTRGRRQCDGEEVAPGLL